MERIKKNDTVVVTTGSSKGKKGSILSISLKKDRVVVKGIAIASKHAKAKKQGEVSGIKQQERSISISNVMPVCSACKKATRVNIKIVDGNKAQRMCNRCKEIF
jgi:large subunit ribosomal protein L24